jgi:hypothetical protein
MKQMEEKFVTQNPIKKGNFIAVTPTDDVKQWWLAYVISVDDNNISGKNSNLKI